MQVVFNCQALVFKFDLSQNLYVPIVNDVCDIQLVSINPRAGDVPGRKLLAFEKGSSSPFLVIDFNSNISLQQTKGPGWNNIRVHSASEIKDFLLETVGQQNEIYGFSEWLHRFADRKGMVISPQQDYSIHNHQIVHSPPGPNESFIPGDQSLTQNMNTSHLGVGGIFSPVSYELQPNTKPEGYSFHERAMHLDYLKEKNEKNIGAAISSFPPNVFEPALSYNSRSRIYEEHSQKQGTPEIPKTIDDFRLVNAKVPLDGLVLNPITSHSASTVSVKGTQATTELDRNTAKQTTESLCSLLAETIRIGDEKKASDLASELARRKSKVALHEALDEEENKSMDTSIKVTVQIEDKQFRSPVLIKLDVDPNVTDVGTLKRMLFEKYSIPINVQRWVIGKRLPKDHEILRKLEVKTTGTVIYLYLLSANDASSREEKSNRVIENRDKAPSLPPRDYRTNDAVVAAPLNARSHRYATVPSNLHRASDVQRHGADFRIPQQEEFFMQVPAADQNNGQQKIQVPVVQAANSPFKDAAPPTPMPLLENQGWKCPACTYINIPTRPGCEQCCGSRPADYKLPPNFEIDEGERQRLEEVAFQDQLAHNYQETAKELQRLEAIRNYQETLIVADQALIPNREPFDCPICFDEIGAAEGVVLRECLHKICRECLKDHIRNSEDPEIPCPCSEDGADCRQIITAQEIQAILPEEEYLRYLQLSVNAAETRAVNSFHCRTTNCHGWCYYEDEVNWFDCDVCQKRNCLTCKAIHDNMTCKEYQDDLKRRADNEDTAKRTQAMLEELIRKGDAMKCPQCSVVLQKKDGCDWMRCSMCRTEICWATKGRRWGPKGNGDTSGGCKCTPAKRCHPRCGNCH